MISTSGRKRVVHRAFYFIDTEAKSQLKRSKKAKMEMSELPDHHHVLSVPEKIRGRRLRGRSISAVKSN